MHGYSNNNNNTIIMFRFTFLLFAVLVSQAGANLLRSESEQRHLSEEKFINYDPLTTVTDHAAIDLDQAAIESQLAYGTDQGRAKAMGVYTEGAFSKSYAEVKLTSPLQLDVGKGLELIGKTATGDEVRVTVLTAVKMGDNVLQLQYATTPIQEKYVNCQVGANPSPNTAGCLAPTGELKFESLGQVAYTYDPLKNNYNARTIQGFSLEAEQKMYKCAKCPYATYEKYYKYYKSFTYADDWVTAAFNKQPTPTGMSNGANFNIYGMEGTAEAVKKGTAYMNIWMYVIREMEDAIDDCTAKCGTDQCNDDQVHAWDEAVAYYTGSTQKTTIFGTSGYLLYTLAQKRCANFGTCIREGTQTGMAKVNSEIFRNFIAGKQNLQLGNCAVVEKNVKRITQLMAVPLIQGTLRYAYAQDKQNDSREKSQAEGATFAAAVLPLIADCSPTDAKTIYDHMSVGHTTKTNFAAVKKAFENTYICLGITCDDVGGLVEIGNNGFLPGAEACGHIKSPATTTTATSTTTSTHTTTTPSVPHTSSTHTKTKTSSPQSGPNVGLAVGLTVGIVAALLLVSLVISRKAGKKEFDTGAEGGPTVEVA